MTTIDDLDLDTFCPGILRNPYLGGHFPHPKQLVFLAESYHAAIELDPTEVYEALFGGAAGGGKSDAALMAAAQMAFLFPGSSSVIIRRTHAELTKPGALLNRAMQWWLPAKVAWNGTDSLFRFPNGSQCQMGYHAHPKDDAQYQGAEYQLAVFDELTYFSDLSAYMHVRSRLRRPEGAGWPLRLLATANPGGPGHSVVKARFVTGPFPFFPSLIDDNPSLDRKAYKKNLMHLHPTRMEQLLLGNWDAKEPGDYFRAEWFGALLDPADKWPAGDCTRIRWWDLAATEDDSGSETAGVLMARHRRGVRAVEHCAAFRLTPGARDARIVQVAKADGPTVVQGFEIEPGSGGPAQVHNIEKALRREVGCRVVYARPKAQATKTEAKLVAIQPRSAQGKAVRAEPVSACVQRGYQRRGEDPDDSASWWGLDRNAQTADQRDGIRLFAGPWTQAYLDDMEAFPLTEAGNSQKILRADKTDATVGAWKWLEAHAGTGDALRAEKPEPHPAIMHDIHPRQRRPDTGKDRAGRWKP